MRARLIAIGLGMASLVALAVGAIVPACYSPPQPACGFVCGAGGACPADYTCAPALDNRCHLNGMPVTSCELVDAGVFPEVFDQGGSADSPDAVDAMRDGMVDAVPMIDAMVDAAPMIDAMADAAPMIDAMADAAPMIDAMADAAPMIDAMLDAAPMVDAAPDAAVADAATD